MDVDSERNLDQMRANGDRMRQQLGDRSGQPLADRSLYLRAKQDQMAQQQGGYQGGLGLPEQLPPGPVDPRMQMAMRAKMMNLNQGPPPGAQMLNTSPVNPADEPTPEQMANPERMAREAEMKQRFQNGRGQMMQRQGGMGQPLGQPIGANPVGPTPMAQPAQMGTPAQAPMANIMNPNANSARPSMGMRPNMNRGQMMGRRAQMMNKQQGQAGPEVGGVAPRSVTPF